MVKDRVEEFKESCRKIGGNHEKDFGQHICRIEGLDFPDRKMQYDQANEKATLVADGLNAEIQNVEGFEFNDPPGSLTQNTMKAKSEYGNVTLRDE